jgi:hypothetical protein
MWMTACLLVLTRGFRLSDLVGIRKQSLASIQERKCVRVQVSSYRKK